MDTKIDLCIPTMNRIELLFVLGQSIPASWKVFVSDNGAFLERSGRSGERDWVVTSSEDVIGLYPNWRKAASMGNAPWFFLPSDDDLYYPLAEDVVRAALQAEPDVGMIIFGHNVIDENGGILGTWIPSLSGVVSSEDAFDLFKHGVLARMPSVLFNRAAFVEVGGISDRFSLTAGDSEIIHRLCIRKKVLFVPEVISAYRVWNGSFTHQKIASKKWSDEVEIWMEMLDRELRSTEWGAGKMYRCKIQDEIRLRNIRAGLSKLETLGERFKFLGLKPYPKFASLRTHLGLLKLFVKTVVRF